SLFFFFFQAEDGIRDDLVTGVQTCALPISCSCRLLSLERPSRLPSLLRRPILRSLDTQAERRTSKRYPRNASKDQRSPHGQHSRSEERRVGKECRYRCRR